MGDQGTHFLKGAGVQEIVHPLTGRQFFLVVLFFDPFPAPAQLGQGHPFLQCLYFGVHSFNFLASVLFFCPPGIGRASPRRPPPPPLDRPPGPFPAESALPQNGCRSFPSGSRGVRTQNVQRAGWWTPLSP